MLNNAVRFADFECVLLRLGFQRKTTSGTQELYEHTLDDTWILLPAYRPEETVRPLHLLSARKLIAERGIAEEDVFDRMLSDAAHESDCTPKGTVSLAAQSS